MLTTSVITNLKMEDMKQKEEGSRQSYELFLAEVSEARMLNLLGMSTKRLEVHIMVLVASVEDLEAVQFRNVGKGAKGSAIKKLVGANAALRISRDHFAQRKKLFREVGKPEGEALLMRLRDKYQAF